MIQLKMASVFFLISFSLGIVYLILTVFSNHRLEKEDRCSFRNSYPYNFYMNSSLLIRGLQYSTLLLSGLMGAMGEAFFFAGYDIGAFYFLMVLFPLSFLLLCISNILSLNYYRAHIITSASAFFLFSCAMIILAFHAQIIGSEIEPKIFLPVSIISGIIGFAGMISMANPKLFAWAKMNKTEENGKTYYVKPKWNFYAFYEWIFLALEEIVPLMLFLNFIFANPSGN